MGIFKLIVVVLAVWLGFGLLKKLRKPVNQLSQNPSNKMLVCGVCNTHIPESEAIVQNGKIYCSKDCL